MAHCHTYLLLIVYSCVVSVMSTPRLVRRPLNTAVIQGSAVKLRCSSDVSSSFIQWYNSLCVTTARSTGDCTDYLIYSGFSLARDVPQRFSVTENNNSTHVTRDLNINPTQLTDAGVYLCAERRPGVAGVTDSSSAQLIVLGDMSCTTNVSASEAVQEHDVIVMTCSVTYSGNWAPVMRWFNSSHNFTADKITLPATVTSQLTITASADLHGSQIDCLISFTQPSPPLSTTATNVPSYTDTCTSPAFNIHYAPRNIQITPGQSVYQPQDRIGCSAEGNPEPWYQWTDLVSGTIIQGAVLVITEDMMNKSHAFQCTASNQYNNISSTLRFTVEAAGSSETSTMQTSSYTSGTKVFASTSSGSNIPLIAGVVGGVVVLLIIVIVVVVVCLRKRRRSGETTADTYQELNTTQGTAAVYDHLSSI